MEGSTILAWIAILGVLTGFRAMLPLAILSLYVWRLELPMPAHLHFIGHIPWVIFFCLLAFGELCADKWKGMPNRTAPLGLAGRIIMAGIGGALLAASTYSPWWKGALVCAALSLFGAALGFSLRQYFREATRAPDFYIAVGEDVVTILGVCWVLEHLG